MARVTWTFVAACLTATPAVAADKLAFAPPPPWVKPTTVAATKADDSGPAARILLADQQIRFAGDTESTYVERVILVRNATGLSMVGNLNLGWDPATDTVTVHKVRIRRGDQAIDVLAKQSFTIIRRETELERSMIDGYLTATLQPEGLEAGDIVEFAYTLDRTDKVFGGRADTVWAPPTYNVERARLIASWPASEPVRWQASKAMGKVDVAKRGGDTLLTIDLQKPERLEGPAGAPPRYRPVRKLELSEFASWETLSATVYPLFDAASRLTPDSPLRAEVARIRALSPDPKVRAGEALKLVEDKIRYTALLISDGGYTPVDVDTTWKRRFGDCKAKTVMLMALLRELGIESEAALVNAYGAPDLDGELPRAGAFNHVIVRATIDGKVYWLDGTRTGDSSLAAISVPRHHFALPLRAGGAPLEKLVISAPDKPMSEVALDIDASAGIDAPAPAKADILLRGDLGLFQSLFVSNLSQADRDRVMKMAWARYPWLTVEKSTFERDPVTGEARVRAEGVAKLSFGPRRGMGRRGMRWADLEFHDRRTFERKDENGKEQPDQDAPFGVGFPQYSVFRLRLSLPRAAYGFLVEGDDVDVALAGMSYVRRVELKNGVLTAEATARSLSPEISAKDARAAVDKLQSLNGKMFIVTTPSLYVATAADMAAWKKDVPKTAADFVQRGLVLGYGGDPAGALADFDAAVRLDPKSDAAYAERGSLHMRLGDNAEALQDIAKALELNPRNPIAVQARAAIAMQERRWSDAVAAFSRGLELAPSSVFARSNRARAYKELGEYEKALADLDDALQIETAALELYDRKLQIYRIQKRDSEVLTDIDRAIAASPKDVFLQLKRAALLVKLDRRSEAERALTEIIAKTPSVTAYMTREGLRDRTDYAGRLSDTAAALKLDPNDVGVVRAHAAALRAASRAGEAQPLLETALKAHPEDTGLRIDLGETLTRMGEAPAARRTFAEARRRSQGNASLLNDLCWTQATRNVFLAEALADCEAARKLAPTSAPILDSNGFVLLRLGRHADAVQVYDAALKLEPELAPSLYGRGIAKRRMGKLSEGDADIASARSVYARVEADFESFGLKP